MSFTRFGVLPLLPRDTDQPNRVSTTLELLFDLVTVIAVSAAAAGLYQSLTLGDVAGGLLKFCCAFFAIWWAWMNYTWYASAYDNNDSLHRLLTLSIMAGSLIMAAGIPSFFATASIDMIVVGFVVMRFAMVLFWLRAALADTERRQTALRYAAGICLVQVYWVSVMQAQPWPVETLYWLFATGALLELSVPVFAESARVTPWHRRHLIERYGLLNIIVLGESLLAGALALQRLPATEDSQGILRIAGASLVIVFALWWVYFSKEESIARKRLSLALVWGYGHLLIYMAGAAVGAGLAVVIGSASMDTALAAGWELYAVALPVGAYLFGLWWVRDRFVLSGTGRHTLLFTALAVSATPAFMPLEGIALALVLGIWVRNQQASSPATTERKNHGV
ncbi:MAG: low temperature requirement protein A [Marinobacter sp.]|nr:low temperature requirement protein A [Marinobacter sp.]